MFESVIGQEKTKKKLEFFLKGQKEDLLSPNILFVAPRGCGKSMFAYEYAKNLKGKNGKTKPFHDINCSTITRVSGLIEQVLIPYTDDDRECTIFFDEASEIPKEVCMALLTILNPNEKGINYFPYDGRVLRFDFRKVTFLFATTEAHKIFHALIDRLERVDLEEYTPEQLGMIVEKLVDVPISPATIKKISSVVSNGRKAVQLSDKINKYVRIMKCKKFGVDQWSKLVNWVNILPLGLTDLDVKVLRILAEKPETTLTNLSAKTMMSSRSLQKDLEIPLQKHNLMEVVPKGRRLTEKGKSYLKRLNAFEG